MSLLLEKHLTKFLFSLSGLEPAEKERFNEILARLVNKQESGSSCLPIQKDEEEFLLGSEIVSLAGENKDTPLIIFAGKLFFHRYHHYESRMAAQLQDYMAQSNEIIVSKEVIDLTFDSDGDTPSDQRLAAEKALSSSFVVVSGGPGTGKTTTALKILSLLHFGMEKMDVALAAPTGKAAQRLYSSIVAGKDYLPTELAGRVDDWLPDTATTIHRLLGVNRNSINFRHNKANPLPWDVILIDEASMVDIAMMAKLIDALKPGGRLILLGDKDQLASVESGTVLSTLIGALDSGVELRKTYRFNEEIKNIALAINSSNVDSAWTLLEKNKHKDWRKHILDSYGIYFDKVNDIIGNDADIAFAALKEFMVLAALRNGHYGVGGINNLVEKHLQDIGHKDQSPWYVGRPILITQNDYKLGLYNGDIGICLLAEDGNLRVFFENGEGYKSYLPIALCQHETVYAMTVHKSQGSEFSEVLLVLPEKDNQVLSRELIYTAITRAKKRVSMVAEKDVFSAAIKRFNLRDSGLYEMLKKQNVEN